MRADLSDRSIAVVISTRNRGRKVTRAIETTLANNYPGCEVIVVDQSDDTLTATSVHSFLASPNVRYLRSATGALSGGNVTQGYHGADARILDNYSGPASCLWALRSLVADFYFPEDSVFWRASSKRLPIENGDYSIAIAATGWQVRGATDGSVIEVERINGVRTADRPLRATRL